MNSDDAIRLDLFLLGQKIHRELPSDIPPEFVRAWNRCPIDLLRERLEEVFGTMPKFLKLVSVVSIPATNDKFVARDHFVVNTSNDASVRISYLDSSFQKRFLAGAGKIEDPVGKITIRCNKFRKLLMDGPTIAEIGGEGAAETPLAAMFFLMKEQGDGRDGVLLNNGSANIFYILDANGTLCSVSVRWYGGGWCVRARGVGDPRAWFDGLQVFSRNLAPSDTLS